MSRARIRAGSLIAKAKGRRPLRYLVAAGINTAVGLALYPVLLWSFAELHEHYLRGLAIAQGIGLCSAFLVYKCLVFKTRANLLREFGTFASFYLINYAVNWIILPLLVEGIHVPPIAAQFAFSSVLIIGSYFWHSRLTFRPRKES